VGDYKLQQKELETPLISTPVTDFHAKDHHPKWEKLLPKKFTIATTEENPTSLKLKVEIETTDTAERSSVTALVDSRATGEFIDRHYAKSNCFNLVKLTQPIPVYNIDGTLNEAGSITEVVTLILCYNNHSERTTFAVSGLDRQKLILGHSWLCKHNPEINWLNGEVKMSRCPPWSCSGCRDEVCQECIVWKAKIWRMDACTAGPMLEISHNLDNLEEKTSESDQELLFLEGENRIIVTSLLPPPPLIDIRASSTISQHLAEAFKTNSEMDSPPIPEYLKEFTSMFSKNSFDILLEPKEWDHSIKIIPGSKASNCKVYLLSPSEQKELDAFLKENLATGHI
jgi:hypothetical protein